MASAKQIAANKANSRLSTGPKSREGKQQSCRNAYRHGMTAETVIAVLEDRAAYQELEAEIQRNYQCDGIVTKELISRLASLIWRLRRATAIETGLLQIQSELALNRSDHIERITLIPAESPYPPSTVALTTRAQTIGYGSVASRPPSDRTVCHSARAFLRLANLDNGAFERLSRYEKMLWRQLKDLLAILKPRILDGVRRKPSMSAKIHRFKNAGRNPTSMSRLR